MNSEAFFTLYTLRRYIKNRIVNVTYVHVLSENGMAK